jgi:D-alanyl-D-alanine carboxypeptidase
LNIEKELKRIHQQYKWASEQTLEKAMRTVGMNTAQVKKAIDSMQRQGDNAQDLLKLIKNEKSTIDKLTSNVKSINEVIKTKIYESDVNPIKATAELVEMAAGGIANFGSSSNTAMGAVPSTLQRLGGVTTGVAGVTAATAGVLAIYGEIFSEQEKVLRAGIDMGVSMDPDKYTEMADTFANLGQSINEIFAGYRRQMPMLANLPGTAGDNLIKFANFANVIKSDNAFPDFGYTARQVMRRLVDEAEIVRRYGGLADINSQSERVLYDRFIKSSVAATTMADLLGVKRDDLLERRQEAAQDIDFTVAVRFAQSDIVERFGQIAYDNIIDFQTNVNTVFGTIFDGKFANETTSLMTRAITDQNFGDVMANMSPELNQILNLMGNNVKEQYVAMIQSAVRGNLSGVDADLAIQGFIQSVAQSTPIESIGNISDPIIQEVMEMQAQARIAPEAYLNATRSSLEQHRNNVAAYTESADGIVDGMDSIRRAFLQISRIAAPGFSTTGTIVGGFGDTILWLTDVIGLVLGPLVNYDPITDDEGTTGTPIAPPRPRWWQNNGFISTSPRHPQRVWDSQYGEYFESDGTLRAGADPYAAAAAVALGPTGAMSATLTGVAADPGAGGTLKNGRLTPGELQAVTGGGRLRVGAADAFNRMVAAAAADGVTIQASSTYRDYERQLHLWNTSTRPLSERRRWVAYPGGSNHGWGLAFDEGTIYRQHEAAPQYQWLRQHGMEYGFYQRMAHETWHWEYTGAPGTTDVTTADPDASAIPTATAPATVPEPTVETFTEPPVTPAVPPVIPARDDGAVQPSTTDATVDPVVEELLEEELESASVVERAWASIRSFFDDEATNERAGQ